MSEDYHYLCHILEDTVKNLRDSAHWRRTIDPKNQEMASVLEDVASAIDAAIPKAEITITTTAEDSPTDR